MKISLYHFVVLVGGDEYSYNFLVKQQDCIEFVKEKRSSETLKIDAKMNILQSEFVSISKNNICSFWCTCML